MQVTELGFTYPELFEMALSLELIDDGDDLELEELQEMLSDHAGYVL